MGEEHINTTEYVGKITSGIQAQSFQLAIISFVQQQLPMWRDDPSRRTERSEPKLNSQLYKFLDHQARMNFPMIRFGHEEPQYANRAIDISVLPDEMMFIEAQLYTIYDPVLVIECKRLPAPSSDREKEYVSGKSPDRISGGIQRFKLGLHGAEHDLAAMVGYIQNGVHEEWIDTINRWIKELAAEPIGDGCVWSKDEILCLDEYSTTSRVGKCKSKHRRSSKNPQVEIYHLWISMRKKSA